MAMFPIFETQARTVLSPVAGFLRAAGFTHSLTPARNCTYGCTYCYVPTMRVYGGLKPEDWARWGQFTTQKVNAGAIARRELRATQIIYCSPLVDPYQPAESWRPLMPDILAAVAESPPAVFVLQTRGPLVLRDMALLERVRERTCLRISFSVTTNRDDVRRRYEPHCEPNEERLRVVETLRRAGFEVHATLAPLLPCDPESLAEAALAASERDLIGDPLHVRLTKARGATTRPAALAIAAQRSEEAWFDPSFQATVVGRIQRVAAAHGRCFRTGPEGFGTLATVRAANLHSTTGSLGFDPTNAK